MVHGAWRTTVRTMLEQDPEVFFGYFRMTPAVFGELLARLAPALQRSRRFGYLPPGERLALTLHYLASGSYMKFAGAFFCVPPSTTSVVIRETCELIRDELRQEMIPPLTEERLARIRDDFWEEWQFPNCIGALDGRHCIVQNFPGGASDWFNYKDSFSMVMMAMCDAKYRLTHVDVGGRGRRSDGGLWELSPLRRDIASGDVVLPPPSQLPGGWATVPQVIVADAAFPIGPHLMKPFGGAFLADEKIIFNYRLSRARRMIEAVFGILTARWRVLRRSFISSERTARAVIWACCCLHNFLILNEENVPPHQRWYAPPALRDAQDFEDDDQLPRFQEEEVEVEDGDAIRELFVDFFLGPGSVPWQWEHLLHP
ncbi:hypothetical protein ONE63_011470 [Megalurothrips usitatus]|uniref:DDE Tnp4 domain-containing protein n=1 Tax=Megalurothrips usitatus TaxID=439358 RepID=A0AAV7WZW6_9NEOP|nr:hypothetical protein ONE63_011470 [Megalurothrips usitatus]